jgi:catechol 2,3-dioxygenase-like lactoylglutathione lyase family enzyme
MTDFIPRRDVQAISHINVVVDDIEVATEFYRSVLGFEQAANADGPMDYPGVDLASFARDAGFDDGRVSLDVRFLKHPEVGVYLELFTYHHPKGDQTIHRRKTNDLGGIRHVAVEVPDAVAAHAFIRFQQQAYGKRGLHIEIVGQDHIPEEITPFPYKFFYCRSVGRAVGDGARPPGRPGGERDCGLSPDSSGVHQARATSGPIPKFASARVMFRCELRNPRTTSNFMIPVRF